MPRKINTETTVLLEARQTKIDQMSQIADQIQQLRFNHEHLQSDVEKLDFALSILDPSHVPMDAKSSTSGRLLIEAQPAQTEQTFAEASARPAATVEETATPKRPSSKATAKSKLKKNAGSKKNVSASTKSKPVPQAAVDAAKEISARSDSATMDKVRIAREIVNGYISDLKPAEEIAAIVKKAPKRGMTVNAIADAFLKAHPLEQAQEHQVMMALKNRLSSNIGHMMKKGLVEKGKPSGEMLTHYSFSKPRKGTPARSEALGEEAGAAPDASAEASEQVA